MLSLAQKSRKNKKKTFLPKKAVALVIRRRYHESDLSCPSGPVELGFIGALALQFLAHKKD